MKIINIFKVKDKKNEKYPDYRVSLKVGDVWEDIGAGWVKDGKAGKYISIKLNDATPTRKGWNVVSDQNLTGLTEEEKAKIIALKAGAETKKDIEESANAELAMEALANEPF